MMMIRMTWVIRAAMAAFLLMVTFPVAAMDAATKTALLGTVDDFISNDGPNGYTYFDTQRRQVFSLTPSANTPVVSSRANEIYVVSKNFTTGAGKPVDVDFVLRRAGGGFEMVMAVHDQAQLIDNLFGR